MSHRIDGRALDQLRPVRIIPHFTDAPMGSVLIECGNTRVICTASVEEGVPPFRKGKGGWLTAEYAMLPGATGKRKPREYGKRDGRSVEISRLIGRSLRAACDLGRLGENTVTIDCDVLQADGGTRCASITGGFVAMTLACHRMLAEGRIPDSFITRQVAAVSCGLVGDEERLDLCYEEDSRAQVDMNVVLSRKNGGGMEYVECQASAEGRSMSREELNGLMDLGEKGNGELMEAQLTALGDAASVIGKKPRLVLASGNFGKLREMRALLGDRFDVVSQKEMGAEPDEETGETFAENAVIKAESILRKTGCASIADDSGLAVDALGGRPGVHSARYCGVHGDDEANNQLLLRELKDVPAPRTARYVCAMALARPGRPTLVAEGTCEGQIIFDRRGEGGFGYDPYFLSDDLGVTFAEAEPEKKNGVSHRARAIAALLTKLDGE